MEYKAIELLPADFYAVIDETGKNYHFTQWTNSAAIKHFDRWGDKNMGTVISEIGDAAYLGIIAYWLLAPEEIKDFKDEADFQEKLKPYYYKKSDLENKVLKAMGIGMIPTTEEGADVTARFSATSESQARGIYRKVARKNWLERFRDTVFKPKTNTNKTV